MKKHYLPLLFSILAVAGTTVTQADSFKIDPVHSAILFKINHFGVGNIYGRFDTFAGTFTIDQADPSKDAVSVEIKTDSVDSNAPGRDKDIKSPDFFNAVQYPTATFKSTSVKKVDDKTYQVTGDFTLRGVTKPLTLDVKAIGTGPGPKGETRSGWEGTATLKRSDFEVKTFLPAVGDDVGLTIEVEGIKQ
jgi:polyisoprenoid-binding protein YceI